jgi:hypothetical protein
MRITNELARTIADTLLAKSKQSNEKLRSEIDALAIAEYQLMVPQEIIKVSKSCPSWIAKADSVSVKYRVNGTLHHHRAYAEKGKKVIILKAGDDTLKVNTKSAIRRKIIKLKKAQDEYWKLRKETIQAMIALGSSKRVIEQFPETAPLFKVQPKYTPPPAQKTNLSGLKSKLQKQ